MPVLFRLSSLVLLALLGSLLVPFARAFAGGAALSVHDLRDGRPLPIFHHAGRQYVVGEPGREYEIRIRNLDQVRVLAVTSVDGVNVLSGETASPSQSGYVVEPGQDVRIDGWRKSLTHVASFRFAALPESYAARTGRPDDVGVIGVALFRERAQPCCPDAHALHESEDGAADTAGAAEAPSRRLPRAETSSADSAGVAAAARQAERLGTAHGRHMTSHATQVSFERASPTPDEILVITYGSRAQLIAQGVIPRVGNRPDPHRPRPFPALGFVPDP